VVCQCHAEDTGNRDEKSAGRFEHGRVKSAGVADLEQTRRNVMQLHHSPHVFRWCFTWSCLNSGLGSAACITEKGSFRYHQCATGPWRAGRSVLISTGDNARTLRMVAVGAQHPPEHRRHGGISGIWSQASFGKFPPLSYAASRGVLVPVLIENVTPPLGFGLILTFLYRQVSIPLQSA